MMSIQQKTQASFLILLLIMGPFPLMGQTNSDSLYQAARAEAFESKNNVMAISLIQKALELDPEVVHYRVFYGRLLAWEARYPEASTQLDQILMTHPNHLDARLARLDVALWSGDYVAMDSIARKGLEYHPDDLDLMFQLGMAQSKMGQAKNANTIFQKILEKDPTHARAKKELQLLGPGLMDRKFRAGFTYDRLADTKTAWQFLVIDPTLDPWAVSTLEYEQATSFGPLMARLNVASRFKQQGAMLEVESYPKLDALTYAYLGLGVSGSSIYPKWKLGAELFRDLGTGFEGSLGFRYLSLPSEGIIVYTGSAGKYLGNYWANIRTFITPNNESLSRSLNFQVRRYLADAEEYIELSGGSGEIIDEGLGAEELSYLGARRFALMWRGKWTSTRFFQIRLNLENQETRPDRFRGMTGVALTLEQRF